jgi:hypothetical protein
MIKGGAWRVVITFVVMTVVSIPAAAATARLERVLLLPSADRSSVVFELTAEPARVTTRRVSDSVLELEAGPGVDSIVPQLLKAPANVRFIDSVTVRVLSTQSGSVILARIALSATARAVVRSAGRRVYVDVSEMPSTPQVLTRPAGSMRVASSDRPAGAPAPAAHATPEDVYRAAVRPSIEKLKELGPFLSSAAGSADPQVTLAILPTIASLRASMAALQPPDAARGSHTMVMAAVDRIARALAPDFTGDRAGAVRQSMTTIEVVGGVLAGE